MFRIPMTSGMSNTRLTRVKMITTHMISIIICTLITICYWLKIYNYLWIFIKYEIINTHKIYALTRSLRYGISSLLIAVHCSVFGTHEFDKGHQPQR